MPGSNKHELVITNSNDVDKTISKGIKHPLQRSWSMWIFMNEKGKTWEDNLVKLTTFDTVEDFWCLYHYMKQPSELKFGQDYALFKDDIRPMWEDPGNVRGGRWLISFEKKRNISPDTAWIGVLLLLIGENFENPDLISGAVINVRIKTKIGIWLNDAKNINDVFQIGRTIKNRLNINCSMNFHKHNCTNNLCVI